jgi:hypothetical protein
MPGDPHKQLVTLTTFPVVAQVTGRASGKDAGAPVEFTPAVALVIRADDANAATILWGMGQSANDPLAKGETVAVDLPPGYYMDLSQLAVNGTAGDQIHVVAAIIQAAPGA